MKKGIIFILSLVLGGLTGLVAGVTYHKEIKSWAGGLIGKFASEDEEVSSSSESGSDAVGSSSESVSLIELDHPLTYDNRTVECDGTKYTIVANYLPDEVVGTYIDDRGNETESDIGVYYFTASFTVPEGWAEIADMHATLTIVAEKSSSSAS